jgi:hypothetical protein
MLRGRRESEIHERFLRKLHFTLVGPYVTTGVGGRRDQAPRLGNGDASPPSLKASNSWPRRLIGCGRLERVASRRVAEMMMRGSWPIFELMKSSPQHGSNFGRDGHLSSSEVTVIISLASKHVDACGILSWLGGRSTPGIPWMRWAA